jgi:hypothetical protein
MRFSRFSHSKAANAPRTESRWRLAALVLLVVLLMGLIATSSTGIPRLTPLMHSTDHGAKLILHQQTQVPPKRTSPAFVAKHVDYIETLPFDGITVDIPASFSLMQGQPISYGEMFDDGLEPLTGAFNRMQDNFVMVYIDYPGDAFDDSAWAVTVENYRNLARAVRDAGLAGIFLDNEAYNRQWTDYPEDYDNPTHSLKEYQAQVQLRGQQIMEAMVSEYPEIELLLFHGPYLSEPETPLYVRMNQAGASFEHELHGPFFVGFLEGLGDRAKLMDGGEVYQYRTARDFRKSYEWRKWRMPSAATNSAIIPDDLRKVWPDNVSISFGVYTEPYAQTPMNPEILKTTLEHALRQADDYVWLYTEDINWMAPDGMPEIWSSPIGLAVENVREGSLSADVNLKAREFASTHAAKRRKRDAADG